MDCGTKQPQLHEIGEHNHYTTCGGNQPSVSTPEKNRAEDAHDQPVGDRHVRAPQLGGTRDDVSVSELSPGRLPPAGLIDGLGIEHLAKRDLRHERGVICPLRVHVRVQDALHGAAECLPEAQENRVGQVRRSPGAAWSLNAILTAGLKNTFDICIAAFG